MWEISKHVTLMTCPQEAFGMFHTRTVLSADAVTAISYHSKLQEWISWVSLGKVPSKDMAKRSNMLVPCWLNIWDLLYNKCLTVWPRPKALLVQQFFAWCLQKLFLNFFKNIMRKHLLLLPVMQCFWTWRCTANLNVGLTMFDRLARA